MVVANGVESEPASGKDAILLSQSPHLVLDGIAAAVAAVGASEAYLCVEGGHPQRAGQLSAAIADRAHAGIDEVQAQLVAFPGRVRGQRGVRAGEFPERRPRGARCTSRHARSSAASAAGPR